MDAVANHPTPRGDGLPLSVRDLVSIASARRWYFLVPAILGTTAAILAAALLPAVYRSAAVISVESQQIPTSLIQSTITSDAAERIDYITQRVLTRNRVLETVRQLKVYPADEMSDSEIVERFRENVEIELVSTKAPRGRKAQTISFTVSFTSSSPEMTQLVANELVTMYLDENVKTRSARAAQTTEFLAEEGEKIREQVKELEREVSEFKEKNSATMPELMQMNLALMSRYENEYQSIVLSLEELQAERNILELQRDQYRSPTDGQMTDLAQLQRKYADLLVQHTRQHPDAVYLRRQIERVKAQQTVGEDLSDAAQADRLADPTFARITTQLAAVDKKAEYLQRAQRELKAKLAEQEARVSQAPAIEREYTDLQRDLSNLESKYQEIRNKEIEAKISQNLEEDQKGERFSLLEAAVVPSQPESPNRPLILGGGLVGAFMVGLFAMGAREFLNPGIRSTMSFERLLGAPPLLTIPDFAGAENGGAVILRRAIPLLLMGLLLAAALVSYLVVVRGLDLGSVQRLVLS